MLKIIECIELRAEQFPNEIWYVSGERKIFNFDTPPEKWPDWNPAFDTLKRGRPTRFVVRITEIEERPHGRRFGRLSTTRDLVGETPPPDLVGHVDEYMQMLEAWPHVEERR